MGIVLSDSGSRENGPFLRVPDTQGSAGEGGSFTAGGRHLGTTQRGWEPRLLPQPPLMLFSEKGSTSLAWGGGRKPKLPLGPFDTTPLGLGGLPLYSRVRAEV